MTSDELIRQYGKNIGTLFVFTASDLIASHRRLRKDAMRANEERLTELRKAREQAMQAQLDSDWIKIEQLRSMTVAELGSFLAED